MQRKTLTAIATWMALASPAFAQQPTSAPDFSKVEIKTMEFGDRTHVLEGQGGNMTVAAARNGVILVDGKFAPLYDKITAAIAAVSPQPVAATDAYLKLANDKIRFVPGHGTLGDKAALTGHRTMLVTARDRMAKPVMDGKSEDEVLAAKPFAELDTTWAPSEQASKNFVRVVYHSLANKPDAKS
jgi:hypothetical protein